MRSGGRYELMSFSASVPLLSLRASRRIFAQRALSWVASHDNGRVESRMTGYFFKVVPASRGRIPGVL